MSHLSNGDVAAWQPSLFSVAADAPDHEGTGGPAVAVDTEFSSAEHIQLDDTSWVVHVRGWLSGDEELMSHLMATAPWEQRSRWMYTRMVREPRLTAEYPVIAAAGQPVLSHITDALASHFGVPYSRLWMNWYRDNQDGTGWHADRPVDRLPEAVIPVLSLGASRRFLIRPDSGGRSTVIVTHGGDLVVMGGRCQKDYRHMVPKQRTPAGPRLSLNFSPETPARGA